MNQSCLSCNRYGGCSDPSKNWNYLCSRFSEMSNFQELLDQFAFPAVTPEGDEMLDTSDANEFDLEALVEEMINSNTPVPPDIRVDDRDMPLARNFYEFATSRNYLGFVPYAKQMEIGIKLYAEYCPRCTDMAYLDDVPVGDSMDDFAERVVMLEHNVCPRCRVTKNELIHNEELVEYMELAGCAGQRGGKCIRGDSLLLTADGLLEIQELAGGRPAGFSPMRRILCDDGGRRVATSHFYVENVGPTRTMRTSDGKEVTGTDCHPLMTTDGWKTLERMRVGDIIPVRVGQEIWPSKVPSLKPIADAAWLSFQKHVENTPANIPLLMHTGSCYNEGPITPTIARLLGYWTAEGTGGRLHISNHDPAVLDDAANGIRELFFAEPLIEPYGVGLRNVKTHHYWNFLLDGNMAAKSGTKFIPSIIRRSPRHIVVEYLRALYEGDGGFNGADKPLVEYCSLSERLVRQISALLGNLGIIHAVYDRESWATNGSVDQVSKRAWIVSIYGDAVLEFERHIGFLSKHKRARLAKIGDYLRAKKLRMPFWYQKYPEPLKRQFLDMMDRVFIELRTVPHPTRFGAHLGRQSVFDRNSELRRIYSDNVALSKRRVVDATSAFEPFVQYLSPKLVAEIREWAVDAADLTLYYTSVSSVRRNRKQEVTYDVTVPNGHRFMANGLLNHNSAGIALYSGYTTHGYLKLQNPTQVFSLLPNSVLMATFVALTFQQAMETLWTPVLNLVNDPDNWFGQYNRLMDHYSAKYGEELYAVKDTLIRYKHRSLLMYPSGPNMKTLRGRTRFLGAIDEIGWFNAQASKAVKMNADEVYIAMQRSFQTLRGAHDKLRQIGVNAPPPIFGNISSPASQFDKIMQLYKESEGSRVILGFKYATWEMNPNLPRESKFIEDEFRRDFQGAMRDYGANPPMSSSAFIGELGHLRESFDKEMSNGAWAMQRLMKTASGRVQRTGKLVYNWRDDSNEKIMALDAGFSGNHFAVAIMHNHPQLLTPVIDVLLEIIPEPQHPINFPHVMENILSPLIEAYNVTMVVSDRWQSIKLLQDIEVEHGIEVYSHSLKYPDFDLFRQDIFNGNLMCPWPEIRPKDVMTVGAEAYPKGFYDKPVAHFMFQLLTVEDYPGIGVEKGESTTDDLFRATVLGHRFLVDELYKARFAGLIRRRAPSLGVYIRAGEGRTSASSVGVISRPGGSFGSGASRVGVRR